MTQQIVGVEFNCITGQPKIKELKVELITSENGEYIQLIGGVTGYESFYIDYKGKRDTDRLYNMVLHGWFACVGTTGSWNTLYIHGLQMKQLFDEFGICYEQTI
jgi:hypothetical protein